ncbi:MAG: putative bifunctional diguanylate cyclase/phosphodiesterase [Paracoccaceae bacterium]
MFTKRLKSLRTILTARHIIAVTPLAVLLAYLYGGEPALVGVALALPLFLVAADHYRGAVDKGGPTTTSNWRDTLIDWVERALPLAAHDGFQVAVIFITIDDLDTIEARFGRVMYDNIFLEATTRLKAHLRDNDTLMQCGSSLAIGLCNVRVPENESLVFMAERLKTAFEAPFSDGPTRTYCTISMGIAAESHVKASSGTNLVAGAMRASELAAISEPGAVRFYSGGLSSEEALNRNTARELNNALETSEIFAWFQPQVRADSGRVIGFEALARWDHPDRGLVSPASFLPDIEKSGLSQRLAEVILKQSLMAMNVWDAAGYDVPMISVNFSAEELKNPRLPDYIRWELDRHSIAPERLVIEVLESVASESSEDVITRTLHALARIGCRIDLDDFGTGYTSFINIRRFDVKRIKIDRSLVNQVDSDSAQHAMFAALLAFGKSLGIETLAEGVETEAETKTVTDLGCQDVQGYAISRPLPLGETLLWLEENGGLIGSESYEARRSCA